jgi:hypothetical protein
MNTNARRRRQDNNEMMTANQRTHACGANELIQHLTYPDCLKYESDDIEWHLPVSLRAGVGGRP